MRTGILLLLLFTSLLAKSQSIFETDEFKIAYPPSLNLIDNVELARFALLTDHEDEEDEFMENINLTVQPSPYNKLGDVIAQVEKELDQIAEVLESVKVSNKKANYHRMVFKSVQQGLNFTITQHYYLSNNKVYVLTYTCESDAYERYFEAMNKVLNSFELK